MSRDAQLYPGYATRVREGVFLIEDEAYVWVGGLEVVVIAPVGKRYQVEDAYGRQWPVWSDDLEV